MNDDQITALAREYAEEKNNAISFKAYSDPEFKKELHIRGCANDAKDIIKFLLRRYCLVEKEKLKAIRYRNVYSAEDIRSKFTEECLIDALFPDLGKEVEE